MLYEGFLLGLQGQEALKWGGRLLGGPLEPPSVRGGWGGRDPGRGLLGPEDGRTGVYYGYLIFHRKAF